MVNNLIVCSLCQLRFTQVSDKQAHYELNHSLKFLKYCSLCDCYIFFITDLRKHSKHKSHLVLNPYYSWRQLTSPGLLTGDFNCKFCSRVFNSQEELDRHYSGDNCNKFSFVTRRKYGLK